MQTALQGYASGSTGTQANAIPAPPAPTLVRAMSQVEDLNKRLYQLCGQVVEMAQTVGGPYPVSGQAKSETAAPAAMQRLNDNLDESHLIVGEIESALAAIRRSLGG